MEGYEKEKNKEISIFHEKDVIENLKKYYNIDDHFDLNLLKKMLQILIINL
jgi:hypothetical protein